MDAVFQNGLLEQPELSLGCGTLVGPDGRLVGLVNEERATWWTSPIITVREAEQEPLVFTIARRWCLLPRWDVTDSEGELVGTVGGRWAVDRREQPVLRLDPDGQFRSPHRVLLGRWDGQRLLFGSALKGEPLARMLMLATILHR